MSTSSPLRTPSTQVGGWHSAGVPRQTLLTQSLQVAQRSSAGQGAQVPPPQSMSVSLPLRISSSHAAAWQAP
jgi:hypothetical protein